MRQVNALHVVDLLLPVRIQLVQALAAHRGLVAGIVGIEDRLCGLLRHGPILRGLLVLGRVQHKLTFLGNQADPELLAVHLVQIPLQRPHGTRDRHIGLLEIWVRLFGRRLGPPLSGGLACQCHGRLPSRFDAQMHIAGGLAVLHDRNPRIHINFAQWQLHCSSADVFILRVHRDSEPSVLGSWANDVRHRQDLIPNGMVAGQVGGGFPGHPIHLQAHQGIGANAADQIQCIFDVDTEPVACRGGNFVNGLESLLRLSFGVFIFITMRFVALRLGGCPCLLQHLHVVI
mmetsp:Transcript_58199/g.96386  ORF Transcript_58199/g.96386 Transcript_58199/m.96386 type:complete len:288 (-) Transcript_58199:95-958(-)